MQIVPKFARAILARLRTEPSQQLTAPYLRLALWCAVVLWWAPWIALGVILLVPSYAQAGSTIAVVMDAPINVSLLLVGLAFFLSSGSAGTALLMRLDRELSAAPGRSLPQVFVFCFAHMSGGWMAGTLAFMQAQSLALDVWAGLSMVVVASFAGAKVLEYAAERAYPSARPPPAA